MPRSQKSQVDTDETDKWQQMFERQNEFMLTVLKQVTTPADQIVLPEFNPAEANMDARSWLAAADMCMTDVQLEGSKLMIVLNKSLKSDASVWLSQIAYPGMTWTRFRELFAQQYDYTETMAAFLVNMSHQQPKSGESIASYSAKLLSAVLAKWKNKTVEQIATATVIAHIAQIEPKVQRLLFTTEIDSRAQMQRELNAMILPRKRQVTVNGDEGAVEARKIKLSQTNDGVKCFTCGKIGHKAASCRMGKSSRSHENLRREDHSQNQNANKVSKEIICFKCGEAGHIAPRCPTKKKNDQIIERRVDLCVVNAPTGMLYHTGKKFMFNFDSGAECSLIRETASQNFKGKMCHSDVMLTGIGQVGVKSNIQIVADVQIEGFSIKVVFCVVPDCYLKCDVLLGREILAQGLVVVLNATSFTIEKEMQVNQCVKDSVSINVRDCATDAKGEDLDKLCSLMSEYKNCFSNSTPDTAANVMPMQIRLKDPNKTVYRRPYRLSQVERGVVRDKINELLAANVIRPSISPYASPIILVKKKNGSYRMCVDYRELNENTIPERFPLPLIEEQIDRLYGCHHFTTLDLTSGYHQIPMHPDSVEKTAFITPDGQYEFLRMPFGLRNAPAVFQRAMSNIFGVLCNTYVTVYMDDVMVLGDGKISDSLERLKSVFEILAKFNCFLNFEKCYFLKEKVEYLGFVVSKGEISPNPKKIEALVNLPPPETVSQVRQFIGLASYFRKFIQGFSQKMSPLYALLQLGNGAIKWTDECEQVRNFMIKALTNAPILMIFNPDFPIELHTDASAIGFGATLLQIREGKHHSIAYFSKKTTSSESRYHSYELETLAVVKAIKHFRHYLQNIKFTVVTDCNSLKAAQKKLELTPRVQRWWVFLQSFEFDVVHRNGSHMLHADFFSRNPLPEIESRKDDRVEIKEVDLINVSNNKWILVEQQRDESICKLIKDIKEQKLDTNLAKTYDIRSGILFRKFQRNGITKCLPILPRSVRWSFINSVHNALVHLGWKKTLEKVAEQFWFEGMNKYVAKFVDNCIICKVAKTRSGKVQTELHPIPKIAIPWHTVHIDATGKLSGKSDRKEYVFVIIDAFTKYVLLYHSSKIDAVNSIKALKFGVSLFGSPSRIIADQGRCFDNTEFKEFCKSKNVNLHLIATGTARANGQVERIMSILKNMLTSVEVKGEITWQEALPDIQLSINCSINRVTKFSPLEVLIGKVARPLELMFSEDENCLDLSDIRDKVSINIEKNAQYDKKRFDDTKAKIKRFNIGDYVLLQNEERNQTKLDAKYRGPFKIVKTLENDRYIVKALDCNREYKYAHERLRLLPKNDVCENLI